MTAAYAFGPGCHQKYIDCPPPPEYLWAYTLVFVLVVAAAFAVIWYRTRS